MIRTYHDIDLTELNTFGIRATARRFIEYEGAHDLRDLAAQGIFENGDWKILAGGSNILFTGDYEGTLLHPTGDKIEVIGKEGDSVRVRVEAGAVWDDFVEWSVGNGLWGVENLSGIPGLTGAAPVQNIGAYGVEAGQAIIAVHTFAAKGGTPLTIAGEHCDFGYRTSIFKGYLKGKAIVTHVDFNLCSKASPNTGYGDLQRKTEELGGHTLDNIRKAVIHIRDSKLPDPAVVGNAGSFFKNPIVDRSVADRILESFPGMPVYPAAEQGQVKLAAGWLIDQCGWKGKRLGNAGVHERQALVLINRGNATGKEISELAHRITGDVREKFGISLVPEVEII